MEYFMVPVFNVGGKLCEDENGVLKYVDGTVHRFAPLDIEKDSDIVELRNSVVENHCVDFEIFFEHPVSEPIVADDVEVNRVNVKVDGGCVNLDSDVEVESSSHDSYESIEDQAYKPPPDSYELSSDSDEGGSKKVKKKKKGKTKIANGDSKKNSPKKNPRKSPRKKNNGAGDDLGNEKDDGPIEGMGGMGNGAKLGGGGKNVKKNGSRKYAGKRKEKSRPNFGPTSSGSGPNTGPSTNGSGSRPKGSARGGDPIIEEVDSEEDKDYAYESEAFVSPISSDEEGGNRHK
ncbi:hypothetical protein PIB30_074156 [Stylosanthes scabra]|uniref:Uncharacterized protein n=1 Tax=Stylosanthes scabra TaxID=79078 RepID=A0ABU6UNE9_9FABA|nr:hypothetical protein [Stylosanthes scabra]